MHGKQWLMVVVGILLLGSLAGAAMWQLADAPADVATAGDTAPASRGIFPKVLNR
ncbi:MAG: hypothetical protein ACRERC_22875 [Candidatus Binatia bacterium]